MTVSLVAAGCGLLYALYRAYYGLGGTLGMIGTPASRADWRLINLVGAVVVIAIGLLPVVMLPLWRRGRARRGLLALCWLIAVYFVMHALIEDTQRVLSLAGLLQIRYPAAQWLTVDSRAADIQDLAFNESFFLAFGFLWAALAWLRLGPGPARRKWTGTALAAIAALTAAGLLSAFGVIGRLIIG
ncbi:MAG TPA: hypothetical protein VH637_11535 [Streptosporangiaceae bacterium]